MLLCDGRTFGTKPSLDLVRTTSDECLLAQERLQRTPKPDLSGGYARRDNAWECASMRRLRRYAAGAGVLQPDRGGTQALLVGAHTDRELRVLGRLRSAHPDVLVLSDDGCAR